MTKQALDNLPIESPLGAYLIHCYSFFGSDHGVDKSRFATLPSSFLTEVLVSIFDNQAPREDMNGIPWCDFHDHQDKPQRRRCEKGRPKDPDMVAANPKLRHTRDVHSTVGGVVKQRFGFDQGLFSLIWLFPPKMASLSIPI